MSYTTQYSYETRRSADSRATTDLYLVAGWALLGLIVNAAAAFWLIQGPVIGG